MGTPVPADPLSAAGPGDRARAASRRGLYVHVPFCATHCTYCDFASGRLAPGAVERWASAIEREADLRAAEGAGDPFTSVFFGGGTPSAIPPATASRVMAALRARFAIAADAEITLEANPESVDDRRLAAWRAMGVDRLSFGAQSFEPGELAALGRVHDAAAPERAVARARGHGFARLSLDLMFGFPGQTGASWGRTLARALATGVEHLSAYAFIPEAGTPLGNAVARGEAAEMDGDLEADLYAALETATAAAGLVPYETSNFGRPDAEARHNLTYWLRRPYLALGPSAHGFTGGERYANHYGFGRWAADVERGVLPEASRERETPEQALEETLFLGLRLASGLDRRDHGPAAWAAFERRYGAALAAAEAEGRIERAAHGWRIPAARRFVADDVIAWIAARGDASATAARPAASRAGRHLTCRLAFP